jgi:hypothetical protein
MFRARAFLGGAVVCIIPVFIVLLPLSTAATECNPEDVDNNGFTDRYEQQLVNKFCPSIVLPYWEKDHWGFNTCPEPVEIVTNLLWRTIYDANGAYAGTQDLPGWTDGNYSGIDNNDENKCTPWTETYNCGTVIYPYPCTYHFDYGGISTTCSAYGGFNEVPNGWYHIYNNGNQFTDKGDDYPHTVYAHPFMHQGVHVIQYWFFYPFNDWINNHEGDWEHINVVITSDDPHTAEISRIIYYFHHCFKRCEVTQNENPADFDCFVVDGSHPVVFVGGYGNETILGAEGEGWASHGSYPYDGRWHDVADLEYTEVDEYMYNAELSTYVSWCEIVSETQDNRYGVVLLKERYHYNYDENPEMSWLQANIYWGHILVSSFGDDVPDITGDLDVGNHSPVGPAYNGAWNIVDWDAGGYAHYYGLTEPYSKASESNWTPPANPSGVPRNMLAVPGDGSTVSGLVEISGTAEWSDDSIVVDWRESGGMEWSSEGVEMSLWMGPYVDYPYATWITYPVQGGYVTLRARAFTNGALVAEETIEVEVEHRSTVVADDGSGDFTSIQDGIDWAEYGDTVYVAGPADYEEHIVLKGGIILVAKDPDVAIVGTNENCTVELICNYYPCFVNGFIIKHQQGIYGNNARGMTVTHGKIELTDCVIRDNRATNGAGIRIQGECEALFERCTITNNEAYTTMAPPNAGASAVAIQGSQCIYYPPEKGHPIVTFIDCDITGNTVYETCFGHTVFIDYACTCLDASYQQPRLERCNITDNVNAMTSVYFSNCYKAELFECLIADNMHDFNSYPHGAVYCLYSGLNVENCTIVNNHNGVGTRQAGVYFYGYPCTGGYVREVRESIIAYNHGPAVGGVTTNFSMIDSDVYENVSGGAYGPTDAEWLTLGTNVINEDPLFCDMASYDYGLFAHSPCVNNGIFPEIIGARAIGCVPDCVVSNTSPILFGDDQVLFASPAGLAFLLEVTVDFDDSISRDIEAHEMTLDFTGCPFSIFDADGIVSGTADATAPDYKVIIEHGEFGGYGAFSAPVLLNEYPLGQSVEITIRTPDETGDGVVDISDFSHFGESYQSPPKPYVAHRDYNDDGAINLSDFSYFADHYNESAVNPPVQTFTPKRSPKLKKEKLTEFELVFTCAGQDRETPGGQLPVELKLKNISPFETACVSLRNCSSNLSFKEWIPNNGYAGSALVTSAVRDGENEIFIGIIDNEFSAGPEIALGTLVFTSHAERELEIDENEFALTVGDIGFSDGSKGVFKGIIKHEDEPAPNVFQNYLAQNYPNPFNPNTTIEFSIKNDSYVILAIYSIEGKLVKRLINEHLASNVYRVEWDGTNENGKSVASGVYFYRLDASTFKETRKFVLLR